jgi:hypothetical protein
MADNLKVAGTAVSPRRLLVPLALAQFICSFAGSNMNVMINDISKDLDTTVQGCRPRSPWMPRGDHQPADLQDRAVQHAEPTPAGRPVRLALGRHPVANREG